MQGDANTSDEIGGNWDSSVLKNVDSVASPHAGPEQPGIEMEQRASLWQDHETSGKLG